MNLAPNQDGRLHLAPAFTAVGAEPSLHLSFALTSVGPAFGFMSSQAEALMHEQQESARHEINLAALLACLMADDATEGGVPRPISSAADSNLNSEIVPGWDDDWMKFGLSGTGGEAAWHLV